MQSIIVAFVLAFTLTVNASVVPLGLGPLGLGPLGISPLGLGLNGLSGSLALGGPTLLTSSPGLVIAQQPIAIAAPHQSVAIHASTAPAGVLLASGTLQIAGPQPHAIIAPNLIHHEGQYVAQTRGALHTAPLPGHINSASSVNLQPAPGTL